MKIATEAVQKISNFLKSDSNFNNIKFDISISKDDTNEFKLEITGMDIYKIEEIESYNYNLSKYYGFTQNIIGMEFESSNRNGIKSHYKIVGFKKSNRKYPIIANNNGSLYKFSPQMIKNRLGGEQQINRLANLSKLV